LNGMDRTRKISIAFLVFLLLFMRVFAQSTPQGYVSKYLGIDCSRGIANTYIETHGGFLGDGDTFIEMQFLNEDFEKRICETEGWKEIPLTENLEIVIHGISNEEREWEARIAGEIPTIKKGYYYFVDRHYESVDKYDDSEIFNRSSYNYTIAIYDADMMILYYCEEDT